MITFKNLDYPTCFTISATQEKIERAYYLAHPDDDELMVPMMTPADCYKFLMELGEQHWANGDKRFVAAYRKAGGR